MDSKKSLHPSRSMTQVEPKTKGEMVEDGRLVIKTIVGKKPKEYAAQVLR